LLNNCEKFIKNFSLKELGDIFLNIFSQIKNFVEEFKKRMEFLFFILMRGISGYFLLHTSAKNDYSQIQG